MPPPLLLDLSHTSHTRARTGVQRVARSLWRELGNNALPVCFDPYLGAWRPLESWEIAHLTADDPGAKRTAQWPWGARIRGYLRKRSGRTASIPENAGFLTPEIFSPDVAGSLSGIGKKAPKVALFHDALALRFPELTPQGTVARFPAYLQELLQFDGIAAVSEDSRAALLDYWAWLGLSKAPPVVAIPLGVDHPPAQPSAIPAASSVPQVLCVGSIEGRKNHIALLEASEGLWRRGVSFELRLIGLAHPKTGKKALEKIQALIAGGRPLRYDGAADEDFLEEAYRMASFTIYPSVAEGFGLPIAESLARGKPCICSANGACGEVARGGGCLALQSVDPTSLEEALARLLGSPSELASLTAAARTRPVRTWAHYANDLSEWVRSLRVSG